MARNRIIKPEFWSSESLLKVSRDARLLFIGLWNFSDDYGVILNSNRKILGDIFPLDESVSEKNIQVWKQELINIKVLVPVTFDEKSYLAIRSWKEHQIVNHPNKRFWINPEILENLLQSSSESLDSDKRPECSNDERERRKKKEERERADSAAGFESFWSVYPKKKSKGDAEKAWAKLKPNEHLVKEILQAVQRAKTSADWLKESGQFIPYPASWLNRKGWLDEYKTQEELDADRFGMLAGPR